jgi:hypothetical protein
MWAIIPLSKEALISALDLGFSNPANMARMILAIAANLAASS